MGGHSIAHFCRIQCFERRDYACDMAVVAKQTVSQPLTEDDGCEPNVSLGQRLAMCEDELE